MNENNRVDTSQVLWKNRSLLIITLNTFLLEVSYRLEWFDEFESHFAVGVLQATGGHVEFAILRVALAEFIERGDVRRLKQRGFAQIIRRSFIILRKEIERSTFPIGEQRALTRVTDLL